MYYQVPVFLLLQGQIELKCINLQGDEQVIQTIKQKGVVYLTKRKVVSKFTEDNVNIVTKFHLSMPKSSIFIEIDQQSRKKIQSPLEKDQKSQVGLRQENIMKKYMLFPLKYIRIQQYDTKNHVNYNEKFYLLSGRACYYSQKTLKQRHMLVVYEQGYINPKQFENDPEIKLYVFQGSKILIFEQEFMRDDAIAGIQCKRAEHIQTLHKAYQKLSVQEKKKLQIKLVNNYKLNKKQVQKNVYGILEEKFITSAHQFGNIKQKDENVKRISTKNDLISTSSSIKEKCKIRISKKKKIF